jgi:hypothetical protein
MNGRLAKYDRIPPPHPSLLAIPYHCTTPVVSYLLPFVLVNICQSVLSLLSRDSLLKRTSLLLWWRWRAMSFNPTRAGVGHLAECELEGARARAC